jgi:dUTP pyrophosphatase
MSLSIKVKKLHPDAIVPSFAHRSDAGMDLFSTQKIILHPGERVQVPTGIAIELPDDYAALIWDKSGLATKYGLKVMAGVVDAGYRGEYIVVLVNLSPVDYLIEKGHKVAQLLIQKVEHPTVEVVDELSDSHRGEKGFGSSGK